MTETTYTPTTAEDFLLEMSDDALVEILGGKVIACRSAAHEIVSDHLADIFGAAPDADIVARVVDTALAYDVITASVAA